jgi:hypothetical protein
VIRSSNPNGRSQQATVAHTVMAGVAFVVVNQWVLLAVAVEGYMTGHADLLVYSTLASFLCLAAAWCLTRYAR